MLRWSLAFLLVALVAALLGFSDLAAGAAWIAKMIFFLFIACFVMLFAAGLGRARRRKMVLVRLRNGPPQARKG